jgi:rare lipoprotein A
LQPNGFGIQIGTYQELVNVMRIADNLKSSYQKKVSVQVKVVNGIKYYGIILGPFSTRTKADTFKESVKKKFPDAFTVEFGKL